MLVKPKPIANADFYLPNATIDLQKWAVVACDQFTSQPDYWVKLKESIGNDPSTYGMILPEVYLEKMNDDMIHHIVDTMNQYIDQNIVEPIGPSMILIERTTSNRQRRLGLMMNIDLEDYDFHAEKKPMIRATEETIISRIPPRVKIREKAPLELTHVMLLTDDKKDPIIQSLYEQRQDFKLLYDVDLNMDGGHIRGYQITETDDIISRFYALVEDQADPMLFVVGDGNHSLATAKAHWEKVKEDLTAKEIEDHPARYAMVEVVSMYDPGLHIEGIHRVLFNADSDFLTELYHHVDKEVESWVYTSETDKIPFFMPKSSARAYEQVQRFIDEYLSHHKEVKIDYIHGEQELIDICKNQPNSIGICMPALVREDLFPFIASGKVLPRKSFSLGNATSKRYYLESRLIITQSKEENK